MTESASSALGETSISVKEAEDDTSVSLHAIGCAWEVF